MTTDLCQTFWPATGHILGKFRVLILQFMIVTCDALVNSPPAKASSPGHSAVNKNCVSDPVLSDNDDASQQVINMQILSQLKSLGRRLDDMEAKNCKKTSDQSKIK